VVEMLKQKKNTYKADKEALIKIVKENLQDFLKEFRARPEKFGRAVKVDHLPSWKDEKAPKTKLQFGPDIPRDIRDFLEKEMRKGSQMINTRDL
jgi:hypothetical protein